MSDFGFNIPPKTRIAISVGVLALYVLRKTTNGVLADVLTWAVIIVALTAIWHWTPH
ncbi:MAG: hypothetical protein KJN97_15475 [Deltaproteobacteria bacterium]|nr:hypothetical protein [Deltaproteobacteria bacterium]